MLFKQVNHTKTFRFFLSSIANLTASIANLSSIANVVAL